jgi:hypothetical protein
VHGRLRLEERNSHSAGRLRARPMNSRAALFRGKKGGNQRRSMLIFRLFAFIRVHRSLKITLSAINNNFQPSNKEYRPNHILVLEPCPCSSYRSSKIPTISRRFA